MGSKIPDFGRYMLDPEETIKQKDLITRCIPEFSQVQVYNTSILTSHIM
jgi:hypothetical protein